eukprot:7639215-Alexandrium_andersonii.AAC.1
MTFVTCICVWSHFCNKSGRACFPQTERPTHQATTRGVCEPTFVPSSGGHEGRGGATGNGRPTRQAKQRPLP